MALMASMASTLGAYSIPLLLFITSIIVQLFLLPRSFPPSHYDVLGIKRYSSIEEVTLAYEKLSSSWNSNNEVPPTSDLVKIRYAFELLTNQIWKRDYDMFGVDEQFHVLEEVKGRHDLASISEIDLRLLEAPPFDRLDNSFDIIKSENFLSKLENDKALLVQVFSIGSNRCANFSDHWQRIVSLLDGVANTGMVELDDAHLATHLAEKKSTGQPFFRNGLPSLVAFPPGCKSSACVVRYVGELSVDAVTDWFATTILSLPRITYYSKESMVQNFLVKSSRHKVKVIFISRTGERATPFVRQAAKNYWTYASFAFALWQEQESSFWWNIFGVESAPAIVFLREPGVKPIVYHGLVNNSWFSNIMEKNKHQVLPQLRSVTSMELGCDARGNSRAGNETMVWYCAVLAGRQSLELDKMRETMRRVQEILSHEGELNGVDQHTPSAPSAVALKESRLTLTWLDGEAQKKYCFFYINSENSYETCGPRRDITDVPQLFIVRYKKKATEDDTEIDKKPKNVFEALHSVEADPASQLVAVYNGSAEILEIIQWISQIIRDGDSRDLPFFRATTPDLVPEDGDPIWSRGTEKIISTSKGMKQRIGGLVHETYDYLGDPRIGPMLLLGALLSFGGIWLRRSQSTHPSSSKDSSQPSTTDEVKPKRRKHRRTTGPFQDQHPSMTDEEPKDAHQMEFSDTDSE